MTFDTLRLLAKAKSQTRLLMRRYSIAWTEAELREAYGR